MVCKDLSKLTGVSVQTLHHYDRIDLLKPSLRLSNGYRMYSEKDLLQLQQIIALKFFGFELRRIKVLLSSSSKALEHFSVQAKVLEQKAGTLLDASKALKSILSEVNDDKLIPWETIIKLIEVYRMTEQLEKTWAGKVFTPEELKQYANFEAGLKAKFTPEDKKIFTANWLNLIDQVRSNLSADPKSDFGVSIAKQIKDHVWGLYGNEHANLRYSIWEKGFKKGKMGGDRALDPAIVEWIDNAMDNYWRERIYSILDQVNLESSPELLQNWTDLMNEMYGDSEELKQAALVAGQNKDDLRISKKAKEWLSRFIKK
ncbi:MAG: MerR family transcriptional regulator [Rickettsiaceae bacterium]